GRAPAGGAPPNDVLPGATRFGGATTPTRAHRRPTTGGRRATERRSSGSNPLRWRAAADASASKAELRRVARHRTTFFREQPASVARRRRRERIEGRAPAGGAPPNDVLPGATRFGGATTPTRAHPKGGRCGRRATERRSSGSNLLRWRVRRLRERIERRPRREARHRPTFFREQPLSVARRRRRERIRRAAAVAAAPPNDVLPGATRFGGATTPARAHRRPTT